MRAPLIGITTSIALDTTPERVYVNRAYVQAVEAAGGVPVLLPPALSATSRAALWARLDGLLLTGGGDIEPARFGQPRHPTTADTSPQRDAFECELVERALAEQLPVFGICRGMQVLNVALGGSLCQDLASEHASALAHAQTAPREQATHTVKILPETTQLAALVGAAELEVNSFHHQAVDRLGRGLRETARAPDDVIEGLESDSPALFVLGVQWHPEHLVEHDGAARALFAALVGAARASADRRGASSR